MVDGIKGIGTTKRAALQSTLWSISHMVTMTCSLRSSDVSSTSLKRIQHQIHYHHQQRKGCLGFNLMGYILIPMGRMPRHLSSGISWQATKGINMHSRINCARSYCITQIISKGNTHPPPHINIGLWWSHNSMNINCSPLNDITGQTLENNCIIGFLVVQSRRILGSSPTIRMYLKQNITT